MAVPAWQLIMLSESMRCIVDILLDLLRLHERGGFQVGSLGISADRQRKVNIAVKQAIFAPCIVLVTFLLNDDTSIGQ